VHRPTPPRPVDRPVAHRVEPRHTTPAPGGHVTPRETPRASEHHNATPQNRNTPRSAAPSTTPDMGAYRGTISRDRTSVAPRGGDNTRTSSARTSAPSTTRGVSRR
jgi:hypothetical protein